MSAPLRTELCDLPLVEVAKQLRAKAISPVELTEAALARVSQENGRFNAFVTVMEESALERARAAESELARGEDLGPLHGIPVSVKDLFDTAGIRTTAGSRVLANNVPTQDATVVKRLKDAGAVLIGKNNMLEFAYAAVHPDFGPTPNPWNIARSTCGSSSGSGAAVTAGMGYGSLGSDTGGSIRLPAAYCGIVGLKPTYGRVSRQGAVPVSWSCDHIGPMTRTVADCAAMLGVIAGEDPLDTTTGRVPVPDYLSALNADVSGLRIGYADAYLREQVDGEVQAAVEEAMRLLERAGATLVKLELPSPADAVPALLALITAEATAFHLPWLREKPGDYSPAVRERLELGAVTSAMSYIHAQRMRRRITDDVLAAMASVDIVITPTAPTAATPLDGDLVTSDEADPALLAALINFSGPLDLTGFPAVSIPCGFTAGGLPIGMQIVAKPYAEVELLSAAFGYESATEWHQRLPTELIAQT